MYALKLTFFVSALFLFVCLSGCDDNISNITDGDNDTDESSTSTDGDTVEDELEDSEEDNTFIEGDAKLELSTSELNFGCMVHSNISSMTFEITNTGTGTLVISELSFPEEVQEYFKIYEPTNSNDDSAKVIQCPYEINPNEHMEFTVEMNYICPVIKDGELTIKSNDQQKTEIKLDAFAECKCCVDQFLVVEPSNTFSHNFGTVTSGDTSDTFEITLSVDDPTATASCCNFVYINNIYFDGDPGFSFKISDTDSNDIEFPILILPSSADLDISFSALHAGTYNSTLTIEYEDSVWDENSRTTPNPYEITLIATVTD